MNAPAALPPTADLLQSFCIALGLGLLVGLQREWAQKRMAGIRTFALVSLFGALSGLLGLAYGGWALGAGLIAIGALIVIAHVAELKAAEPDSGLTTEMAMLVMFATGVLTVLDHRLEAVTIAGSVMVLLQSKKTLHDMVRKIGEDDLREIARLVLAGLVILPALPNREMGYLGVLNPFSIWLMVVLIVGISLAAYLTGKFFGAGKGTALAGFFGGLVSSTATTASLARRSRDAGACGLCLAAMALIASAVVFLRVIIEVMATAPAHMQALLPPLLAMMAWFGLVAAVAHRLSERQSKSHHEESPPSELKSAVLFGLLYAVVLVVVAAAKQHFGNSGLYAAAALSGLTDMDAITLSTSRLVSTGHLEAAIGWRMILLGGLTNIAFKMILAIFLGARSFIKPIATGFGIALLGGAGILVLWP
ncbi:MAG: MgtC/SapB family protein [Prosthecobacter sp.]